jgi:hypothetical protein
MVTAGTHLSVGQCLLRNHERRRIGSCASEGRYVIDSKAGRVMNMEATVTVKVECLKLANQEHSRSRCRGEVGFMHVATFPSSFVNMPVLVC